MDEAVVLAKLESLRRCVARIRAKTPPSAQILTEDYDVQDIVCVNLERAVQTCVDIAAHILADINVPAPDSMTAGFDELRKLGYLPDHLAGQLKKAVGFRNISVHAYQAIDWAVVFSIITTRLSVFSDFAGCIRARLHTD